MVDSNSLGFGVSFVVVSSQGLTPLISTKLPFLDDEKIESFLMRYSTPLAMMVGQGDQFFTGLYGPFPVSGANNWMAYSYSFFLLDVDIGTPRDEANLYTIGFLFMPKSTKISTKILETLFDKFVEEVHNVRSIIDKTIFNRFITSIGENFTLKKPEIVQSETKGDSKKQEQKLFEELPILEETESLIAVPWILHSVYHGLERASNNILGGSSNLLDKLAEQYTREILDRFHLLDKLKLEKDENAVKKALTLGIEHLEKVGEKVKLRPVSDNKFELDIECAFADAVHPFVPINKCLWIKYLSAIVSSVLPSDRVLKIYDSEFDDKGSITYLEIAKKRFITLE